MCPNSIEADETRKPGSRYSRRPSTERLNSCRPRRPLRTRRAQPEVALSLPLSRHAWRRVLVVAYFLRLILRRLINTMADLASSIASGKLPFGNFSFRFALDFKDVFLATWKQPCPGKGYECDRADRQVDRQPVFLSDNTNQPYLGWLGRDLPLPGLSMPISLHDTKWCRI